jgi:hypothetical protein
MLRLKLAEKPHGDLQTIRARPIRAYKTGDACKFKTASNSAETRSDKHAAATRPSRFPFRLVERLNPGH